MENEVFESKKIRVSCQQILVSLPDAVFPLLCPALCVVHGGVM